jgi:hypothetical protein
VLAVPPEPIITNSEARPAVRSEGRDFLIYGGKVVLV